VRSYVNKTEILRINSTEIHVEERFWVKISQW